jgi:hypothetical protein
MYSAKPRTSSWVNLNRTRMLIHPQANLDSCDAHLPLQRLRRGAPSRQVLLALGVKGPLLSDRQHAVHRYLFGNEADMPRLAFLAYKMLQSESIW